MVLMLVQLTLLTAAFAAQASTKKSFWYQVLYLGYDGLAQA